jgi:hypothetical protein
MVSLINVRRPFLPSLKTQVDAHSYWLPLHPTAISKGIAADTKGGGARRWNFCMPPLRLFGRGSRQICSAASHSGQVEELPIAVSKRARHRSWPSPMLPLEAVAVTSNVQKAIQTVVKEAKLSLSDLGHAAWPSTNCSGSPDSRRQTSEDGHRIRRNGHRRGPQSTSTTSAFTLGNRELAAAVTSAPLNLASNVHVMAELRRCRPFITPKSMLDFGAGSAVSTSAAARVFRERFLGKADIGRETGHDVAPLGCNGEYLQTSTDDDNPQDQRAWERRGRAQLDWMPSGSTSLQSVALVDQAPTMRKLGKEILNADEFLTRSSRVDVKAFGSLRDTRVSSFGDGFDIVSASFSLSEVVQSTAAGVEGGSESETTQNEVNLLGQRRLKSTVLSLWKAVKPGGFLVILENGTLSGFETVLFARDVVLSHRRRVRDAKPTDKLPGDGLSQGIVSTKATVVAPCLHSHACPLEGNKSKSRTCRFVQRLNRPPYLRIAKPSGNGFEDHHFSYTILEKTVSGNNKEDKVHASTADGFSPQSEQACSVKETDSGWGRLVRAPSHKNKHILLDACTSEAKLERRVVSKGSVEKDMYASARKARWGDVWPAAPPNAAQEVKF